MSLKPDLQRISGSPGLDIHDRECSGFVISVMSTEQDRCVPSANRAEAVYGDVEFGIAVL